MMKHPGTKGAREVLSVHGHIGFQGVLFVSAHDYGIDREELDSADIEHAKDEAIKHVDEVLHTRLVQYRGYVHLMQIQAKE